MNNPRQLQPPPFPPEPLPSVMYVTGCFMLSVVFTGMWCSSYFFRFLDNGSHLLENFYALLVMAPTAVFALILGLKAVKHESHRGGFQNIVWDYTRKTNDTRYMPYILPVHYSLVLSLFITSLLLPVIGHVCVAFIVGIK